MTEKKILIIDDEPDHLTLVESYASSCGLQYISTGCSSDAIELIKTEDISVLLTDMLMPGLSGMEILEYSQ